MNQPERLNGMTQGFKRDLVETLTQAQMDHAVRVVVITGSGRAFSAGDDISAHGSLSGGGATALDAADRPGPRQSDRHVRGPALALADAEPHRPRTRQADDRRDQRRRDPDRALARAVVRLPHRIERARGSAARRCGSGCCRTKAASSCWCSCLGVAKTMDFLMRKRIVTAAEALELGLVHEVVAADELMPRTMELARELAKARRCRCGC